MVLLVDLQDVLIVFHMRNFISSMLGTMAALIIFIIAGSVLLLGLLIVINAVGENPVPFESDSYLVLDL